MHTTTTFAFDAFDAAALPPINKIYPTGRDVVAVDPRARARERTYAYHPFLEQLRVDVEEEEEGEDSPNIETLVHKLRVLGYHAHLTDATEGQGTKRRHWKLRHRFATVSGRYGIAVGGHPIIVDIHFREQFCIARMTPTYVDVLRQLPVVFVGSTCDLWHLVSRTCDEMELAFYFVGMHMPPWRQKENMMRKWGLSESLRPRTPFTMYTHAYWKNAART